MKRMVLVSLLALFPLLTACNTIQGVGRDVTKVGEVLEDATT
ncbi:MAG: entericidin A/B family lipoprotein [Asticcacaulis sp.]|nr:entericidin A/B family lipoprotein [Asticcacaulis tiandongensis]